LVTAIGPRALRLIQRQRHVEVGGMAGTPFGAGADSQIG
jgi:hypothetical protein